MREIKKEANSKKCILTEKKKISKRQNWYKQKLNDNNKIFYSLFFVMLSFLCKIGHVVVPGKVTVIRAGVW